MESIPLLHCISLLFLSILFLGPRAVQGKAEVRALMEVKAALDPESRILASWTSEGDPCRGDFEGVACNEHGKVANISLQGKGLSGYISPAVAELRCLSELYLHYNALRGEIPREISNLTELSELYLNVNKLSGRIPVEIGRMESLQVLQLGYNQLTGAIPATLGDLTQLTRLYLSFNALFGSIPVKLAQVPNLEVLDVRNNSLSGSVPSGKSHLLSSALVHQNISAGKVLIDHNFSPRLSGSGLHKLLADDVVFSTLKASAAMGYLAPEYTTVGRFTEKSDVYAFGVLVFQILTGKSNVSHLRLNSESAKLENLLDVNLAGNFSKPEAAKLGGLALVCTSETPSQRPTMEAVLQQLSFGC